VSNGGCIVELPENLAPEEKKALVDKLIDVVLALKPKKAHKVPAEPVKRMLEYWRDGLLHSDEGLKVLMEVAAAANEEKTAEIIEGFKR